MPTLTLTNIIIEKFMHINEKFVSLATQHDLLTLE